MIFLSKYRFVVEFGGLLHNYVGFYLLEFSRFIQNSSHILQTELLTVYHGLLRAKEMAITNLVCYSNSLALY